MQSIRDDHDYLYKISPHDRDGNAIGPNNWKLVDTGEYIERNIYHESLHVFGMAHAVAHGQNPYQPGDEGIMAYPTVPWSPWSNVVLTAGQLDIVKGTLNPRSD